MEEDCQHVNATIPVTFNRNTNIVCHTWGGRPQSGCAWTWQWHVNEDGEDNGPEMTDELRSSEGLQESGTG